MIEKHCPIPGFDEQEYLRANPRLTVNLPPQNLVGWEHFILYGYYEDRPGKPEILDQRFQNLLEDPVPMPAPPRHLRQRVHGKNDDTYQMIGRLTACDLLSAMEENNIPMPANADILDFGCGPGRVLNSFRYLFTEARFSGTDIDPEAMGWCQENLSAIADFTVNQPNPPLAFEDERFDLVYSISVLTHLPEDMQFAWLEELRRVTKPGGHLLLTVHGPELVSRIGEQGVADFEKTGFLYFVGAATEGLPDFYQSAFHNESYIRDKWQPYFDIIDIHSRRIAGIQDLVVCRRR